MTNEPNEPKSGTTAGAVVSEGVGDAYQALHALYVIALNGSVCTPPDTWRDPFVGGDGSGRMFDVEALNCPECRAAWRLTEAALRADPASATDDCGAVVSDLGSRP